MPKPSRALARPLSTGCRVCGSPLHYSGRGRKPVLCGAEACRLEAQRRRKAEQRNELAATGRTLTERKRAIAAAEIDPDAARRMPAPSEIIRRLTERDDARTGGGTRLAPAPAWDDDLSSFHPDDPTAWRRPRSARRRRDHAAEWVAAEHPELLDEWQRDLAAWDD